MVQSHKVSYVALKGENMKQNIDIARCKRAMLDIRIEGEPGGSVRDKAFEDAITQVQANGLTDTYVGVKNYAAFGDQREDHRYNMGPRHGSIVFRIGRLSRRGNSGAWPQLTADHVYFVECVRDFPGRIHPPERVGYKPKVDNLDTILRELDRAEREVAALSEVLATAEVESSA